MKYKSLYSRKSKRGKLIMALKNEKAQKESRNKKGRK